MVHALILIHIEVSYPCQFSGRLILDFSCMGNSIHVLIVIFNIFFWLITWMKLRTLSPQSSFHWHSCKSYSFLLITCMNNVYITALVCHLIIVFGIRCRYFYFTAITAIIVIVARIFLGMYVILILMRILHFFQIC